MPNQIQNMVTNFFIGAASIKQTARRSYHIKVIIGTNLRVRSNSHICIEKNSYGRPVEYRAVRVEVPLQNLLWEQQRRIPFKKIPLRINAKRTKDFDRGLMQLRLQEGL